jgi:hypothetical protein
MAEFGVFAHAMLASVIPSKLPHFGIKCRSPFLIEFSLRLTLHRRAKFIGRPVCDPLCAFKVCCVFHVFDSIDHTSFSQSSSSLLSVLVNPSRSSMCPTSRKERTALNGSPGRVLIEVTTDGASPGEYIVEAVPGLHIEHVKEPEAECPGLCPAQAFLQRDIRRDPIPNRVLFTCAWPPTADDYRLPGVCGVNVRLEGTKRLYPWHNPHTLRAEGEDALQGRRAQRQGPTIRIVVHEPCHQFSVIDLSASRIVRVVSLGLSDVWRISIAEAHGWLPSSSESWRTRQFFSSIRRYYHHRSLA